MSDHKALLKLYNILEYPEEEGLCNGFSLRWLEASLLSKEEQQRFEKRIKLIASTPPYNLAAAINEAKAKKGENLTDKDYELLDILSFYDSLTLFHTPTDWAYIIERQFLTPEDVENISEIASSEEIKKRGGLKKLYSEPVIFNVSEIETYLDKLGKLLENSADISKEPIGVLFGSDNHTVALIYQPGQGWVFRDSNQKPLDPSLGAITNKKIALGIKNGFTYKKISPYCAFNTQVVLTKNDLRCETLTTQLEEFKKTHPIEDIALRQTDTINLVYIAAQNGHLEEVEKLIKARAELNLAGDDKITPIWIAAQNGFTEIVKVLINAKVVLDQADNSNTTAVWAAAQYGHAEVVELLANAGANLNTADDNEQTPLWIAAKKGHIEVVKVLIQYGVKLDELDKEGRTPLWIAAKKGHTAVVKILIEHGANLNVADKNGISLLFIATNNGHAEVVRELGQAEVDLNQVDNEGKTAMWVAAHNGRTEVIKELALLNPDLLNYKDRDGITPLLIAAKNGHDDSVELLARYKDKIDLNQMTHGMTAIFIAAQEGHFATVKKLLEANVDYTIPTRRTVDELKRFAQIRRGTDLRQQIESLIKEKEATAEILLTPYDIATIMGHHKIAALIKEYEPKQIITPKGIPITTNISFFPSAEKKSPVNKDTQESIINSCSSITDIDL